MLNVLMEIVQKNPTIDPDDAFAEFGPLLSLDNLDCYGSRIWMLYKDVCKCDLPSMLAVMRASQLGFTTNAAINAAIDGGSIDIAGLVAQVKERLPKFKVEVPAAA